MCIIEKRYFEKRTMCIIEESFDVQNRFSKSPQGDLIPEIAEILAFFAIIPLLQHVNDALEIPPERRFSKTFNFLQFLKSP